MAIGVASVLGVYSFEHYFIQLYIYVNRSSSDALFFSAFTALYSVPIRPTAAEIWALEECSVISVY